MTPKLPSKLVLAILLLWALSVGLLAQDTLGAIGHLFGRTDTNSNLYVRLSTGTGVVQERRAISSLVGKVDTNSNLYVVQDPTVPAVMGNPALFADGTSGAPSIAFASEPTLGFYRLSAGAVKLMGTLNTSGTTNVAELFVTTTGRIGSGTLGSTAYTADGLMKIQNNAGTIGSVVKIDALPTVGSGFGTTPSVTAGSTPFAGSVNVGTGGVATTGVITFGGTAYPSAPFCTLGESAGSFTTYTATTTALTLTTSVAWPASTLVSWICVSSK